MSCYIGMADCSDETMRLSSTDIAGERPTAISIDESQSKKTCADCGTSKTPLWRGGPAGPKSLCNACGIKSRKKRGPPMGIIKKENTEVKKMKRSKNRGGGSRFFGLGREGLVKILMADKQRRKMREEEEAAVLLMAISHGFAVYA